MDIEKKLEELGQAFEAFKKANDASLAEIKTKGHASAETTEKVDKLNNQITGLEAKIEAMTVAMNRAGGQGGEGGEGTQTADGKKEYAEAIAGYMRKGMSIPQAQLEWAKKEMSVDSDEDGGFLVSPATSTEIVTKIFESSPVRELASVQTISTDSFEILEDLDEAGSGWVGEREARTATDTPTWKKIVIPVHELYAMPKATQKLLDDAAVNLEAWLAGKVSSKFGRDEATAFVSGDGVLKPKGFLSYDAGTSFGQIERVTSATSAVIIADELLDVQAKLKEGYQANATWVMNRLIANVIRKFKSSDNQYIWQPGLVAGEAPTLLGRPVRYASDMQATLAATKDTVAYGDFRAGYQIVDRVGIRVLRDPYTVKGAILFYTTKRVGGGVKDFEAIKVLKTKT